MYKAAVLRAAAGEGLTLVRADNATGFRGVYHHEKRSSKPFQARRRLVGTIKECGHKFCVRCVTTHVHKTMVNGRVLCPLCRTAFNPRSVRKARQ